MQSPEVEPASTLCCSGIGVQGLFWTRVEGLGDEALEFLVAEFQRVRLSTDVLGCGGWVAKFVKAFVGTSAVPLEPAGVRQ